VVKVYHRTETGMAMALPPPIKKLNAKLDGWPSGALSLGLIAVAIILILVAMSDNHIAKAAILAWVILP